MVKTGLMHMPFSLGYIYTQVLPVNAYMYIRTMWFIMVRVRPAVGGGGVLHVSMSDI